LNLIDVSYQIRWIIDVRPHLAPPKSLAETAARIRRVVQGEQVYAYQHPTIKVLGVDKPFPVFRRRDFTAN